MRIRALCGVAMFIAAAAANAGVIVENVMRDLTGGRPERQLSTSVQGGMMRIQVKDGGGMIFKNDVFYSIDPNTKTYMAMDRASIKQMSDQLAPMMKQMQEQLASMPPEQRAQMEKMMAGTGMNMGKAKTRSVRKTTRAGQVAGNACSYFEVLEDGVVDTELCVVPAAKLSGGPEFMEASIKMGGVLKDMFSSLGPLQALVDKNVALYSEIGGIPVLTRTFADGKPALETTLKTMRSQAVPAATFEIPQGYTKREMPTMPARQ